MDELPRHEPQPEPSAAPARERRRRALVAAALALLALAGLAALLSAEARSPDEPAAPPLRLPARRDACLAPAAGETQRARASEAAAGAKIARYPYAPVEGLRALRLLRDAESCYALAGRLQNATAVAARARAFEARLQRDYSDQLIHYRGALSAGRPEQALQAIEVLLELLADERGPFTLRLQRLQHELAPSSL